MFNHLIRGDYIKSLQEWCNENDCLQYLDFWDYEMNQISPDKVSYSTHKKYYFKCINKNHKHKSELKRIDNLVSNKFSTLTCIQCNSFGQWFIDNYSEDEFEKYWDFDKNIENPFFIAKNSHKKIFIKCQKQLYHESYEVNPAHFTRGTRCPYCIGKKVNYYDSLGYKYPLVLDIWSDKNEFSPFDYTPNSNKEVWWKCNNKRHADFKRRIAAMVENNFHCPQCSNETKNSVLYNKVLEYLNNHNIDYVTEFDCNLKPINPNSGKVLPYDIELVNENTIIEVHGSQHYEYENCGWYKRKAKRYNVTTEEYFKQRKSIDDYKEKYAIENGYKFIIIPYWYEKNDYYKEILDNELNNNKT